MGTAIIESEEPIPDVDDGNVTTFYEEGSDFTVLKIFDSSDSYILH